MEQAIWVGYGLLVAVCWVLGLCALREARRTGGLLDWGLAAVTLAAGGVGCPLSFLPSLTTLPPGLRSHVLAGGIAGIGLGSIALYLVNWCYIRPRSVTAACWVPNAWGAVEMLRQAARRRPGAAP